MACAGCRKNSLKVDEAGAVIVPAGAKTAKTAKAGAKTEEKNTVAAPGCIRMYGELSVLDRKAIKLFNTLRRTDKDAARLFRDLNTQFRAWIVKLRHECPDGDLLKDAKTLINNEYAKHFQQ
jgi:hypothetical protein